MKSLLLAPIGMLLVLACKNECEKFDAAGFFKCHEDQQLDSSGIASALIGRWRWQYELDCAWPVDDKAKDDNTFAGVVIEFRADSTCLIHEANGIDTVRWVLALLNSDDGYRFDDPDQVPDFPPHSSLYGRIRLCNGKLWCNNSYVDGGDNFFVRDLITNTSQVRK